MPIVRVTWRLKILFDSEGESSEEELEEFDENGNLVVVRDEVDLYHSK